MWGGLYTQQKLIWKRRRDKGNHGNIIKVPGKSLVKHIIV